VVDERQDRNPVTDDAERRRRFDALFEAHRLDVASYCSWRTRSRTEAEDAVSEVFLVAWRRIDTVPTDATARSWLYATARRVTANQHRSRRRRAALADRLARELPPGAGRPAIPGPDATSPEEAAVHAALARLGDRDREVLLLVEWEGLRPAELAAVLGCSDTTARGRLHRARRRFRAAFDAEGRREGDASARDGAPSAAAGPAAPERRWERDACPPPPAPRRPPAPRQTDAQRPTHIVHLATRATTRKAHR
jgi:RNA polymerase sigma factor (sigma-70 family)